MPQADAAQDGTTRAPDGSALATPPTVAPPALGAHKEAEAELELQQLLLRMEALAPTLSQAALVVAVDRVGRLAAGSPAHLAELFDPSGRLSFADDVQAMELDGTGRATARADAIDVPHRLRRHGLRFLRGARPMGRVCLRWCRV